MKYGLDDILVYKNKQKPVVKQIIKSERKPIRIKETLATRKNMYILSVLTIIFNIFLANIVTNFIFNIINNFKYIKKVNQFDKANILDKTEIISNKMSYIFLNNQKLIDLTIKPNQHLLIWLILFSAMTLIILRFLYKFYVAHRKMHYGQKGDAKFAEIKELKKQYVSVPQQCTEYKGQPGVPITHYNDLPKIFRAVPLIKLGEKQLINPLSKLFYNGRYLIDQDTINVMVIGTSRSGKGESMVFPATDIDTRASEKPSLVFNDPKGELYAGSYETLRKRGYDVEVLNLLNPDDGMSYNMLQIIKDEYIKGDFAQAEAYAVTLTSTLFPSPESGDSFWQDSAAGLVNALIFTVIQRALDENRPDKITMRNVYDLLNILGTDNYTDDDGVEHNALDEYIMDMPPESIARKQYATTQFASGNTRSGILATASTTLQIFVSEKISKMGSANSLDFTRVGFNKRIRVRFDMIYIFKRGVIHYGYGEENCQTSNFKIDSLGFMENYFKRKMKDGEIIRIELDEAVFEYKFYREKPKRGFVVVEKDPYTGDRIYPEEAFLKNIEKNSDILKINCFYSEKPVAVFMVIPDYDTSTHVVASIFISQLYTMLARRASESGGKCHQRVKFRLDEFGNMPAIHDMANILTVCLGRNILFELYVQGYSQVTSKYGKENGETIKDNCQTHIYIKSTSKETNDEISAKCGNTTVTTSSRTSNGGSDFSQNFTPEQQPLIHPELLPKFVRGETIVLRFLKTSDNNRNSIRPEPIYNVNETKLPFRFEFLGDDFEPANQFADFDIPSKHRHLNLRDFMIDWKHKPNPIDLTANGYIASLDLNYKDIEKLKETCMQFTGSEDFYKSIIQAQTKESVMTNMQSQLQHLNIAGNQSAEIQRQIMVFLEQHDKSKKLFDSEISDVPEEQPIYLSEMIFGDKLELRLKWIKDNLNDKTLYETLLQLNKDDFNKVLEEHGEHKVKNGINSLKVNNA